MKTVPNGWRVTVFYWKTEDMTNTKGWHELGHGLCSPQFTITWEIDSRG